jgi:dolichyl-phosphooligosaccharide-protein glycotransferase
MSKKNKNKKSKSVKIEEIEDTIPSFLKSNYIIYCILTLIFGLAFYVRAIVPFNNVFAGGVTAFAMDDAVFHMRLVENLLENFPHRLSYDAFTLYPYGSVLSWGSLFDVIIGSLSLLFGVENLNLIGALVPAIMGALVTIPVYYIGKEIFNKKAGLFGAFIVAIIPGAFLQRSTMGFTDNHVAEVLFSTTFLMFAIMTFNHIKNLDNISIKEFIRYPIKHIITTPLKYSVFAGIFLGLYILTWTTGLIFSGMMAVFIILQIIINHIKNKSSSFLLISTIIIYGISMIMILPFVSLRNSFSVVYYSLTHIFAPLFVIVISTILVYSLSKMKEEAVDIHKYFIILMIFLTTSFLLMKSILEQFYINTFGSLWILFMPHNGGGATIGEAQATSIEVISSYFEFNFILSVIAIGILIYYYLKYRENKILLFIIWTTFIFYSLLAQNRFFYYFSINIAILSGVTCGFILDHVGRWKNIKNINLWNISSVIILIIFIGFYPFGASMFDKAVATTQYGVRGEGFFEWYESLTWMRNNTPDPGLDYYGIYERPDPGEIYKYPETAYGVMSWWDYGHIITYWAHRIPNANPFQSGIGSINDPGAAPFFVAQTEDEANLVLEKLGTNEKPGARYVVSNAYMAYSIQPIFAEWMGSNIGYFSQIRTSQGNQILPTKKFYNTMESKLHIFDTNGLKNYRLIHESVPNSGYRGGSEELGYKQVYNVLINPNNPIPLENSGFVKIFEYVRGANIIGKNTPNSEVTLELKILTNMNRMILYKQVVNSDYEGNYIFTVPYSTTGSIEGETQFDTNPISSYEIYNGDRPVKFVVVTEDDVLRGKNVIVSD